MHCYYDHHYGYPYGNVGYGLGNSFVLIVVLFILLIIVGAAYVH
ncbi:YjcZ family sporulation protein [Metabacillus niabensis]|uniref:Uncharacterized protein (TIGR01732 family) n=1 Tax=Metabacillus niabensis TaxID=324854 RepID=A0ABT9YZL6_9BACI|nr:YjcZ family sporulation protein [Metabacillus niabensis]MDQ0225225.1 uncharacterized protein (TIGR01732 family) [Metabacillus niabensis]PAD68159.1 sporulation protein YjcZ [Bacillus sp. 7586-K]